MTRRATCWLRPLRASVCWLGPGRSPSRLGTAAYCSVGRPRPRTSGCAPLFSRAVRVDGSTSAGRRRVPRRPRPVRTARHPAEIRRLTPGCRRRRTPGCTRLDAPRAHNTPASPSPRIDRRSSEDSCGHSTTVARRRQSSGVGRNFLCDQRLVPDSSNIDRTTVTNTQRFRNTDVT